MKSGKRKLFAGLLAVFAFEAHAIQDTVTVGTIKVVVKEQALLIPAAMAIDSGILEYMAVTKGGKTYESVLAADCDAKDFHAGLLLINAKPGGVKYKNDSVKTPMVLGDAMTCDIVFIDPKGKTATTPAFDLIRHCDPGKKAAGDAFKKKASWVFIGSHEVDMDGRGKMMLASSMEGSLISIIIDATVEISLSEPFDNPYRGERQGFCIDEKKAQQMPKNFFLRIAKKTK